MKKKIDIFLNYNQRGYTLRDVAAAVRRKKNEKRANRRKSISPLKYGQNGNYSKENEKVWQWYSDGEANGSDFSSTDVYGFDSKLKRITTMAQTTLIITS